MSLPYRAGHYDRVGGDLRVGRRFGDRYRRRRQIHYPSETAGIQMEIHAACVLMSDGVSAVDENLARKTESARMETANDTESAGDRVISDPHRARARVAVFFNQAENIV